MKLQVVDLSRESLEGIGRMLTPEKWSFPERGKDYSYADTDEDLGLPSPCSAGVLESVPRPMVLGRMERHLRTKEALIALEGGSSGLAVSSLAMGTQTFGWGADERSAYAMADRFLEAGGNFFDTTSTYNKGDEGRDETRSRRRQGRRARSQG